MFARAALVWRSNTQVLRNCGFSFLSSTSRSTTVNPVRMASSNSSEQNNHKVYKVKLSEQELRSKLTAEQYRVTQEKGTERPFTGEYTEHFKAGVYCCVVCDTPLFNADTKFESHCGWPAFYASKSGAVDRHEDRSHGMDRVETVCGQCGAHLGHVFTDGPKPTGERYCINSASIKFQGAKDH